MPRFCLAPFVLALAAAAAAQELKPGDAAPPLAIARWLQGGPVAQFEAGKVYVVVFWSPWCDSCAQHMGAFQRLQAQHGKDGVTLIAVAASDPRTSLPLVEARVKDKGKAWSFAVAWDDARKTSDAWLKNKELGIHPAFVVDRAGKLAFLGSPIQLEAPLAAIVAGSWDPAKGERWITAASELETSLGTLTQAQTPAALARLEELVKECPTLERSLSGVRFELLLRLGRYDEGDRYGTKLVEEAIAAGDSGRLNGLAWSIVGPEFAYERRNLDLALRAAGKAVELTQQRDGMILDTLARVHAWKLDWKKALELQRRAVLFNPQDDLRKALKEYEEAAKKAEGQQQPKKD